MDPTTTIGTVVAFRREARGLGYREHEIEALIGWVKYQTKPGMEPVFPSVAEVRESIKAAARKDRSL